MNRPSHTEFLIVPRAVDEGVAVPGHVGRKHPDLAVGDLARGPRVLPPHPATGLTLLEKASFIDHQHRIRVGQRLDRIITHHVAQRIRLPPAATKKCLLTPWAGITHRLSPHPAGCATLGPEQAIKE